MADDFDEIYNIRDKFNQAVKSGRRDRHNILGGVFDFYHGMNPREGFIDIVGRGQRASAYGLKEMSDAQIKRALLHAYKKGWDNVYFVRGNKIDSRTTQRAKAILQNEMPYLSERMQRDNSANQQVVISEIRAIQTKMRDAQVELQALQSAGKGQSTEAQAVMRRMEKGQAGLDDAMKFYQEGSWQRRFSIGTSLPKEGFAFQSNLKRLPGLELGPIKLALPFTHAAAFNSEQRVIAKATIKAQKAENRHTWGI